MSRKNLISPINDERSIETISKHSIESIDDTRPGSTPTSPSDSPTNPPIKPKIKITNNNNENFNKHHEDHSHIQKNALNKRIRKMLLFLITNFGMLGLVIGYVVLGALLFQTLEQSNEIQNCEFGKGMDSDMISDYTQKLFNYIYFNISTDPVVDALSSEEPVSQNLTYYAYTTTIDNWILEVRDATISNLATYKFYGQEDCEANSLWRLPSAILFTVTIVTTIGIKILI